MKKVFKIILAIVLFYIILMLTGKFITGDPWIVCITYSAVLVGFLVAIVFLALLIADIIYFD